MSKTEQQINGGKMCKLIGEKLGKLFGEKLGKQVETWEDLPKHWPCRTGGRQAWPSSSCAWSSWAWCRSSSCASWRHHGGGGWGGRWTPSGCSSQLGCSHPPATCRWRWGTAGLGDCPPCPGFWPLHYRWCQKTPPQGWWFSVSGFSWISASLMTAAAACLPPLLLGFGKWINVVENKGVDWRIESVKSTENIWMWGVRVVLWYPCHFFSFLVWTNFWYYSIKTVQVNF